MTAQFRTISTSRKVNFLLRTKLWRLKTDGKDTMGISLFVKKI